RRAVAQALQHLLDRGALRRCSGLVLEAQHAVQRRLQLQRQEVALDGDIQVDDAVLVLVAVGLRRPEQREA
ncbi:conserved hypothetical protein, partial [Ricinus communis]